MAEAQYLERRKWALIDPGSRTGQRRGRFIERRALSLAARLQLPYRPADIEVTEILEGVLGAPVHLTLVEAPVPGASARTFRLNTGAYVIAVQRATTPLHRTHIVLHEAAHLLQGTLHTPAQPPSLAARSDSRQDEIDAETIARALAAAGVALARTSFADDTGRDTLFSRSSWMQ